jgi:PleD family two-component response regulator
LAIAFRNLIKTGDITMLPYQEIITDNRPLVVCVDDHQVCQHMVKYTLEKNGYRVNSIVDPFKALASLQGNKPDFILINRVLQE